MVELNYSKPRNFARTPNHKPSLKESGSLMHESVDLIEAGNTDQLSPVTELSAENNTTNTSNSLRASSTSHFPRRIWMRT